MGDWFPSYVWQMGGVLIAVAVAVLVLLAGFLPTGRRILLRRPLGFFAAYVVLVLASSLVPSVAGAGWVRVVGLACLLLVIARGGLLLFTETGPGRWLVPPLPKIFRDVLEGLLYAAVAAITLRAAGIQPGELLTTSALLTAVVGLALQDTIGNLFSGLAVQLGQHFQVGDWIELDGDPKNSGRVVETGWRATTVLTLDEVEVIVPNAIIAKTTLRNVTRPTPVARRSVRFSASYAASPDKVKTVALAAIPGIPKVLPQPAPSVVTADFGDDAVLYTLRYFTDDHGAATGTDSLVRDRLWYAFGRAGISIPYPQRDVHVYSEGRDDQALRETAATERRERLLRFVPLFDVLPEDGHRDLAADSEDRLYAGGEVIVHEGEKGGCMFVIAQGTVSVTVETNGLVEEIARLGVGQFFGEMSLLTGEPRTATVRAVGECEVVAVGQEALRTALHGNAVLLERLGEVLAARRVADRKPTGAASEPIHHEQRHDLINRIRSFFAI
jgi:small-conductance mechanosensitive channel/CRP-like cAMP-binding protein